MILLRVVSARILVLCACVSTGLAQQSVWQLVNPSPQGNLLTGIWAFNQNSALAVGANGTIIKTSNGGITWDVETMVSGVTGKLLSTQFVSSSIGWAVGEQGVVLKTTDTGDTWLLQEISTASDLYAVNFISPDTGWVAGTSGTIFGTTNGGLTWTAETTGTVASLFSMGFVNSRVGWAVGINGTILKTTNGGSKWLSAGKPTSKAFFGVSCVSDSVVWAAGAQGAIFLTTDAGSTWNSVGADSVIGLYAIQFVSKSVGWVVGVLGTIKKTTNGGSTWNTEFSGTQSDIWGVRFVSPSVGWAVGDFGMILYTTNGGATWNQQSTNVEKNISEVYFSSVSTGWGVGDQGSIVKTTDGGVHWIPQNSNVDVALYGVFFFDDVNGWAVGDSGVIIRTTNGGENWVTQSSHTENMLQSVYFVSSIKGWVVGDGRILRTTNGGGNWFNDSTTTSSYLEKVKFFNGSKGWVVGDGGTIIRTTNAGLTWLEQNSGTSSDLYSLAIINANDVIVVGDLSTILHSSDGGATWFSDSIDIGEALHDVAVFSSSLEWIVGDEGSILATNDTGKTWSLQESGSSNALLRVQAVSSTSGGIVYVWGDGYVLLSSTLSPFSLRTWTGLADSSWTNPANWSPQGVPTNLDSVVIAVSSKNPVVRVTQQQLNVGNLTIAAGARLTLGSGIAQLVAGNSIVVDGVFIVDPNVPTQISVGGSFVVASGGSFVPGGSTVLFAGNGQMSGLFNNVVVSSGASIRTNGNVTIKNSIAALSAPVLRASDTLTLLNPLAGAFQIYGTTGAGTIKRAILQGSTGEYYFESSSTSVTFDGTGTYPDTITVTTYPGSLPPDLQVTLFVRRFYAFSAHGGKNYAATVWLRYDDSETDMRAYDLAFFRDSSDFVFNLGADEYTDIDVNSIGRYSVDHFYTWYLGNAEYVPPIPLAFTTDLTVSDSKQFSADLEFGAAYGASAGIDSALDEIPLGPTPPKGTFDARWRLSSSVTSLIDIRNILAFVGPQNVYTGEFQTQPGGYPFVLSWDSTTLPGGQVFLQDSMTAGKKFNVNMKTQSSFTITDTAVSIFQIVHSAPAYYPVASHWNMLSLPVIPTTSSRKSYVFSTATSYAFGYDNGYYISDTLRVGSGYWVKFSRTQKIGFEGRPLMSDTIRVANGWNMIGSIGRAIAAGSVVQLPSGIIEGRYFGYDNGYYVADSLQPAQGYWIKIGGGGKLVMSSSSSVQAAAKECSSGFLQALNSLVVSDNSSGRQTLYFGKVSDPDYSPAMYELPPPPPQGVFDARFLSQHLVENLREDSKSTTLTVSIQSAKYPVTLRWNVAQPEVQTLALADGSNGKSLGPQTLPRIGSIRIENPKVNRILLTITTAGNVPREFALRQNFPNPFNPSTTIQFDVSSHSTVVLNIYNILGQHVATPIPDKQCAPGSYSVVWNGANYASGVYFYRLVAKSSSTGSILFQQTKKLLLVK